MSDFLHPEDLELLTKKEHRILNLKNIRTEHRVRKHTHTRTLWRKGPYILSAFVIGFLLWAGILVIGEMVLRNLGVIG